MSNTTIGSRPTRPLRGPAVVLALLIPIFCAAADAGPSVEDQLRDLRRQIQLQEIQREADRSIDAIRAREQAERDHLQRQVEGARREERRIAPQRGW